MQAHAPLTDDDIRALFAPLRGMPLALAVSGGADSMALLYLARRWLDLAASWAPPPPDEAMASGAPPTESFADRPALVVLTVDHGLRAEAAAEAQWVVSQARAMGVSAHLLRWTGAKPSQGLQAAARAARYRLMHDRLIAEVRAQGGAMRLLLTAHHQEDQAETVLMRLARGSGLDGLSGMRAHEHLFTDAPDAPPLSVHRPLLGVPKSRLLATLKAHDLTWQEDPSNTKDRFERVRVRKALAQLAELGLSSAAVARSAARLGRARTALLQQASDVGAAHIFWNDGQYGAVALSVLQDVPEEITLRLISRLIKAYGGCAPPPRLAELEALVQRVRITGGPPWPARAATLGGCRMDWRPGGNLRVWREVGRAALPEMRLSPGALVTWDGRFRARADARLAAPVRVQALGERGWRDLRGAYPVLAALRLPPGAAAGLPSFMRGDELIAVAGLPVPRTPDLQVEFIRPS